MKLFAALVAALVAAVALPGSALACDSCIAASSSAVQWAFIDGSIFLSVTPVAIVGAFVWWLRRRAKQFAAEEEAGVLPFPTTGSRASNRS